MMKYSQAEQGRVFVLRLEDQDIVHETIEAFAKEHRIQSASLSIIGGADKGSMLVVGPEQGRSETIVPQTIVLDNVYEVTGTGTLFPNEKGEPILHMHMACGRGDKCITGCIRNGVVVWHVMEVVIRELTESSGVRKKDAATGFDLLIP
jgi:predicted DNA-binding protein with PD1-like motif